MSHREVNDLMFQYAIQCHKLEVLHYRRTYEAALLFAGGLMERYPNEPVRILQVLKHWEPEQESN